MKNTTINTEELLRGIEKFELITRLLPVAVYTTDENGVINYFNEQAIKLWGRRPNLNDPDELRFCGSWKIFDTEGYVLPHDKCPMALTLRDGKPKRNAEIIVVRPDYTKATILAHVDPIFDNEGNLTGAINVLFDVTERKKIEKDVFHLASIVESSDDAIISKTLDGDITSWNKGAERLFGFTSEEVLGKNITIFIPPERIDEELMIIDRIRSGKKVDHFETIRLTKSGKLINVSLTVSPIISSNGKVIGASKVARNIDEQVEIRKKLKQYNNELRKLNKSKDDFISMASHELKTPLTVVKAHLELLNEYPKPENEPFLNKTLLHVDKLSYLINEMLDVSKMNSSKMKLQYHTFNFDEMVRDCIESVKVINHDFDIVYNNHLSNAEVVADRQRLEQVIINLLNNAIKYSPGETEITINVFQKSKNVSVQVIDQGMGIPENKIKNIFNRFYRMEGLSKHIAGLGIGLYISKKIIEKHHGKIWVEKSEPGKGSTFSFSIPREPVKTAKGN